MGKGGQEGKDAKELLEELGEHHENQILRVGCAPGHMPGHFLPSPDTDCLPFLVKLVHVR